MKRDWDIIRTILLKTENKEEFSPITLSDFSTDKRAFVSYNVELLLESGLIKGYMSSINNDSRIGQDFSIYRLTWEGHEFLDSIKNDNVWKKTKDTFSQNCISMSFDLMKSMANEVAKPLLGL